VSASVFCVRLARLCREEKDTRNGSTASSQLLRSISETVHLQTLKRKERLRVFLSNFKFRTFHNPVVKHFVAENI
jgi:hypothetical protein